MMDGLSNPTSQLHQNTITTVGVPLQPSDSVSTHTSLGSSVQATSFDAAINQALAPAPVQQNHQGGLAKAQDDRPDEAKGGLNLVQLGQQFDKISQQLGAAVGDLPLNADFNQVFKGNKGQILNELGQVQEGINDLLGSHPNHLHGVVEVKLHTIANQINIEEGFIKQGGVSSAIGVRDVQRDILDIVNNDPKLTAASNRDGQHGFTPLTPLQNPPQPFHDNAAQTQFLIQTDQSLNSLVQQAMKVAHGDSSIDNNQLIQQIRTFDQHVSSFADHQGGVYSARFDNELGKNGTSDTAFTQLIKGLETNSKTLIKATSQTLLANMGDVGGNQVPVDGGSFTFAANAGA